MNPTYTFTMEPLKFPYPDGALRRGTLYRLFKGDQEVGTFHYETGQSRIRWQDQEIRVDCERRIFRNSSFILVDPSTETSIGYYQTPHLSTNRELFFRQYPPFEFNRIPRKLKDLFKKSAGPAYQFTLNGVNGSILYSTNDSGTILHTTKKGNISILGTVDLPIILAGFLFIELVWEQQSST